MWYGERDIRFLCFRTHLPYNVELRFVTKSNLTMFMPKAKPFEIIITLKGVLSFIDYYWRHHLKNSLLYQIEHTFQLRLVV